MKPVTDRHSPPAEATGALARAIAEFNAWRFYDCHETLEDAWRDLGGKAARRAGREGHLADFYQGIIKVAAGFHHLLRGNRKGTLNLLSDALRLLAPFEPSFMGVDVQQLSREVGRCLDRVRELPPGRLDDFERSMIPRIAHHDAATVKS
jgi:predicted metal-dependent hydrolase